MLDFNIVMLDIFEDVWCKNMLTYIYGTNQLMSFPLHLLFYGVRGEGRGGGGDKLNER